MQITQYPSTAAEKLLARIVHRGLAFKQKDLAAVNRIITTVAKQGDAALVDYTRQFDAPGFKSSDLVVAETEFKAAAKAVSPAFKRALKRAQRQIESFHQQQLPKSWVDTQRPGALLGQLVHPVDTAGVYVPGGQGGSTPLVSSVLMGALPAKIAGVKAVVMVTPPTREGTINPHLLFAARSCGVDSVYKLGSAWAIAALAHGTETVPRADVIVGPGNIWVTLAKKLVAGMVGIDMIAGPSEILIIADDTADPAYLAADLLSQAEHDVLASAVLVTPSQDLAQAVAAELEVQLARLPRREIAAKALRDYSALLVVPDLDTAIQVANAIAPEHLELVVADAFAHIGRLRHAGAIFVGPFTPEPVGDYVAGPNHVLPTAGTARFSSALSVSHFLKRTSLLHYAEARFRREAKDIVTLAEIEGLEAHANAVRLRMKKRR
ncbi:MAG: histidinol dehydrogenase [Desulfosarcinaceae bacterium]|nr:histidinol dehydrogenase [Desulfosarcinaceae bacterium]